MFERTIPSVKRRLDAAGLNRLHAGVRRIRAVGEESYHDVRNHTIGLNPADLRKPYAAFHRGPYLLLHELAHHYAEVVMTRAGRRRLLPLFGDYDAPYRRLPKPRTAGRDHVSRYARVHPAEDFAESFAVCLWSAWDGPAVRALMQGKSALCRRKLAALKALLERESRRGRETRRGRVRR
jgi:hypothetical protein